MHSLHESGHTAPTSVFCAESVCFQGFPMLVQYAMRPRWGLGNFYLRVGEKKHMNPFRRAVDANCRNAAPCTHANTFSVVTRGVKLNPYTFPSTRAKAPPQAWDGDGICRNSLRPLPEFQPVASDTGHRRLSGIVASDRSCRRASADCLTNSIHASWS